MESLHDGADAVRDDRRVVNPTEARFNELCWARASYDALSMRRFTRLTNAFARKFENHAAMVTLYFMFYNVGRVHQTIRVTPAIEAGIADRVWSVEEIIGLIG